MEWLLGLLCLAQAPTNAMQTIERAAAEVSPPRLVRAITALQAVPGRTRVTGTRGAAAGRDLVARHLDGLGLAVERSGFSVPNPFDRGRLATGTNLMVALGPPEGPGLVLIAHLDTKAAKDPADAAVLGWDFGADPAPGADDNASGSAALLELATVLVTGGYPLDRPVYLAWTDAEELASIAEDGFMQGYGAGALAADLADRGRPVGAALAIDMLLRPRGFGYWLRVYSDGRLASQHLAFDLGLAASWIAPDVIIDVRIDPSFTWSDHGAFWAQGQGGLLLIEDDFHHARYHRDSDAFAEDDAFYDLGQVVSATRLLIATVLLQAGALAR